MSRSDYRREAASLANAAHFYAGFSCSWVLPTLPEAHEHPSPKRVVLTVFGFGATFAIAYVATH